jgi:hypothetical protein
MHRIEDTGLAEDTADEARNHDPRVGHGHPDDRPIADVLEQELPVDGIEEDAVGWDDERVEPVGPADWYEGEAVESGAVDERGARSA